MNKTRLLSATLAGAAILGFLPALALAQSNKYGDVPWVRSLAEAKKKAAKARKPIMADYYADWCPPCRAMFASTYTDKRVVERAKRFVPALVNIDKYPKDAERARVEGVPTLVFYDHRGTELLRAEGYHDADELLKLMAQAERKASDRRR